jgi:hypothetical protein
MGAIAKTDADRLTDAHARDAGQALSGLAVYLDDSIGALRATKRLSAKHVSPPSV